ncbi:hypothetical protein MBLNU230_g6136t1 [Neophaeotheca triangularis]
MLSPTTPALLLALSTLFPLLNAQFDFLLPDIPSCATNCGTSLGGCSALDTECLCTNTALIDTVAECVCSSCDQDDQEEIIDLANSICGSYSNADVPTTATCAGSGASSAAAATSSAAAGSSGVVSSAVPTTTAAGAGSGSADDGAEVTSTAAADAEEQTDNAAVGGRGEKELGLGIALAGLLALL